MRGKRGRRKREPSLRQVLRTDLAEMAKLKGTSLAGPAGYADVLALPGTWTVLMYRMANWCHERPRLKPVSRILYVANVVVTGAELHPGGSVGPGLVIPHPVGIIVAGDVIIGARSRILGRVSIGGNGDPGRPGHPVVGDDVWIMDGARVLGPVTVGDRSILGAGAVVTSDVPPDMFVYGARRSDAMRPLAELGLADHGGSLPPTGERSTVLVPAAS